MASESGMIGRSLGFRDGLPWQLVGRLNCEPTLLKRNQAKLVSPTTCAWKFGAAKRRRELSDLPFCDLF